MTVIQTDFEGANSMVDLASSGDSIRQGANSAIRRSWASQAVTCEPNVKPGMSWAELSAAAALRLVVIVRCPRHPAPVPVQELQPLPGSVGGEALAGSTQLSACAWPPAGQPAVDGILWLRRAVEIAFLALPLWVRRGGGPT